MSDPIEDPTTAQVRAHMEARKLVEAHPYDPATRRPSPTWRPALISLSDFYDGTIDDPTEAIQFGFRLVDAPGPDWQAS